jgi:hypothetical protein
MGVGHGRQAYLIPWDDVEKRYLDQNLKITIDEIRSFPETKRAGALYSVDIIEKEHTQRMISPGNPNH